MKWGIFITKGRGIKSPKSLKEIEMICKMDKLRGVA
jgi:hypothetical protein